MIGDAVKEMISLAPDVILASTTRLIKPLQRLTSSIPIVFTGIRPGEKIHEIMVSEEECHRTVEREGYYVIRPMLPELNTDAAGTPALARELADLIKEDCWAKRHAFHTDMVPVEEAVGRVKSEQDQSC